MADVIAEIKSQLIALDYDSARALRAVTLGVGAELDMQKLRDAEAEAKMLRAELALL